MEHTGRGSGPGTARGTRARDPRQEALRIPSLRAPRGEPPTADEADPALHSPRASTGTTRRMQSSREPVSTARGTERGEPRGAASRLVGVHMDTDALDKALPIRPSTRAVVPVLVHSSEVSSYTSEEDARIEFSLVYGGLPEEDPDLAAEQLGRKLKLPVTLRFLPSLQVVAAGFIENHVGLGGPVRNPRNAEDLANGYPEDLPPVGRSDPTGAGVKRKAILELDVLNRTEMALQVWLGERVEPSLTSASWKAAANRPRPWDPHLEEEEGSGPSALCQILGGGHCVRVACPLPPLPPPPEPGGGVGPPGPPSRSSTAQAWRRSTAEAIRQHLALYWRKEVLSDPGAVMEIGTLALQRDLVEQALSPYFQALMCRREVTVEALAGPSGGTSNSASPSPLVRLAGPDDTSLHGGALGTVWGIRAAAVLPLDVRLRVHNSSKAPVTLRLSMACHPAQSPVTPEVLTRVPQALPIGVVTGFTLTVPPGQMDEHRCGVCLLAPGLYCLYAACIDVLGSDGLPVPHQATDELPVTVEPLYILVQ
eukprot:jgi/Botrbrau1/228/Bobra.0022s0207.1